VVFKTIRSFPATPNDTDVIFLGTSGDFGKAVETLKSAGYFELDPSPLQILFSDPRGEGIATWNKSGGIYYVDLYKEASTSYFVYLSKSRLRRHVIPTQVAGCSEVRVLRPEVELAAILMHSVFPEMTYGLENFYTTCYNFAQFGEGEINRFVEFTRRNHITLPVRANLSVTMALHQEAFGSIPEKLSSVLARMGGAYQREDKHIRGTGFRTPHKFRFPTYARAFLGKLIELPSLASLAVQIFHMLNPRFAKHMFVTIWEKRTRDTYVQM